MLDYYCGLAAKWDQFAAYAGDLIPTSEDGLWQPVTDERILAVMPMAPDGAWLYGERGLSSVQIPALIITGTNDDGADYKMETTYIYEQLGSAERYLISFIGKNHMMVFNTDVNLRMNHFTCAFFGYYLQGREDYREYFSEDFVSRFIDLAWGVYGK
jgi:predicted dienelactone hydrolase